MDRMPILPGTTAKVAALALLLACCVACTTTTGTTEKKSIRLCHSLKADSESCDLHFAADVFRDYVGRHSATLEVRVYPNGALGDERSVWEAIQLGSGPDCSISGSAILNNFCPPTSILDLPYLWSDYSHVHRVLDGPVGDALAREIERRGFKFLAWMDSWGYRNIVTTRLRVTQAADLIPGVWTALLAPVIILGGIMAGIFTATEAGVVACVYAFVVAFFVYRSVTLRELPKILLDGAVTTTVVVGIISAAGAFGWLLSYLDFTEVVIRTVLGISDRPMIVVAALLAVMLFLAMFIESLAVLIILIPVIVEVGRTHGMDPVHLGMLAVLAIQIGAATPPVAVGLFVATSIAGTTYDQTIRYCLPFIAALLATLLIVFFFPAAATWVPRHFLSQ